MSAELIGIGPAVDDLDVGRGSRAHCGDQDGIWSFWQPVVLPVVDQFVIVYGGIPRIHELPVQPVVVVGLATKVVDLINVVVIGGAELHLIFWINGTSIPVRVGHGRFQLIVGAGLVGC